MTLLMELPPEGEAHFSAEAKAKGVPIECYITEHLMESARAAQVHLLEAVTPPHRLNLPLLQGDLIGSLNRRDIYSDRD